MQQKEQEQIWGEYTKFKKDYELSLKNNKPFPEIVKDIMREKGLTIENLQDKSKIDRRTIVRLRTGLIKTKTLEMEYLPTKKTIVAFCVACDLDMLNAITLLESLGLSFKKTSLIDYAYCYIITNCRGKEIHERNTVLKSFGIDAADLLRDDTLK